MTTHRQRSRRLLLAAIGASIAAILGIGFAAGINVAKEPLILLPQGINRVPSCEKPEDVRLWDLTCPALEGVHDTVGTEPLIPVDLKSPDVGDPSVGGPLPSESDPDLTPGSDTTP